MKLDNQQKCPPWFHKGSQRTESKMLLRYLVQLQKSKPDVPHWVVPDPQLTAKTFTFLCLLLLGSKTSHLPADACTTFSFSLLKYSSFSELLSMELKCCLGLKTWVLHFMYWNASLDHILHCHLPATILRSRTNTELLTHKLPRLRRLLCTDFSSYHVRNASLEEAVQRMQ